VDPAEQKGDAPEPHQKQLVMLMGARASQVWKDDRAVPAYVAAKGGWRISCVILVCGRDLFALWSLRSTSVSFEAVIYHQDARLF